MILAIGYTTVFTVVGKYVKKINNYLAEVATLTTDEGDITTILTSQSVVRLNDGLNEIYDDFRSDVIGWINSLIGRTAEVITDPVLVTDQLPFGTTPDIQTTLNALIQDMAINDKNVTTSTMTTGSVTRTVANSLAGNLVLGTKLDGVSSPMDGATPNVAYTGVTSLLYPDDETITVTCIQDSENGANRGSEQFSINGTGAQAAPYSVGGENLGSGGTIQVDDLGANNFISNPNFDNWSGSPEVPVGWIVEEGTSAIDFQKLPSDLKGVSAGFALETISSGNSLLIDQTIDPSRLVRRRAYFVAVWAKKASNVGSNQGLVLSITDSGSLNVVLQIAPTSASDWQLFQTQFVVPAQLAAPIVLAISDGGLSLDPANDPTDIDQIVITPATYVSGIAMAIFGGHDKFLQGDTFSFRLQNDNAGKLLTYFRKAFGVQIPVDATPTISDSLVA